MCRGWVGRTAEVAALVAVLAIGAHAPALTQSRESAGQPIRVTEGRMPDSALISAFRKRVSVAVQRTNDYVDISQVPPGSSGPRAGTWRKTWCEMDDVAIEVRSGELEQSPIVAIVTGRTHSDVARGLATREATEQMVRVHPREIASDGRFALLYIHGEGEWRLTLAQFRAELSATPDTLPGPLGMGWQDLWTRELCTKQQDFCIVADIWRHL